MPDPIINRVYDLKIAGYDDSLAKVKALTTAFGKMDAAKKKLNDQLQKKLNAGDTTAVKELSDRIKELEKNMSNLSAKRESSAKETALMAQAEKNLAQAEATRMKNIIQQEKELDRLIAQEERQKKTLNQSTGYYYDLLTAQKAAIQLYRQTQPDSPLYDQIKKGAIDAKAKVDAFNRSLSPDGTLVGEYKSGILNAFKSLGLSDVLKKNRDDIQAQLNVLKTQSEQLAAEYRKTGDSGAKSFAEIEHQLKNNIDQQEKLKQNLSTLDSSLKNTGGIGTQITAGISEGFKNAKAQVSQLLVTYLGFQAVFSGLRQGVEIAKDLSDSTTNLEIEFGKAAGGADKIVDALSKLNTRTKLTVLEDMAFIAAKAGVSEDKIVGVTSAIDKIKVAFGKDFGDVETGTEDLIKLINVFEGTENVTGDNLLRTGNAVRVLANESVASVPFLNDFSKRMAGLKGISNIALPAVLGLASGFEQFGQSSEVAGTTLTKVIPKLGTDTAKYAKIAGMTQQAFSDLLKNDPAEALIKISESLVNGKGDIEDISKAFADSQLGSGRIAAILGTVGAKADDFRKSIHSAGVAYKDTGNIETAFADKNKNLASQLDRVSKAFSDAANSKAFQVTIGAIATAITFLIGNLGLIIGVLSLLATTWAIANASMIATKVSTIATNVAFQVQYAILTIQQTVMRAYAVTLAFLTGVTKGATVATQLLGNAMRLLPLGIILTIIGVLVAGFRAFGSTVTGTTEALRKHAQQLKIDVEIRERANAAIGDQISKMQALVSIVTSSKTSYDTSKVALEQLIASHSRFSSALKDGVINLNEVRRAMADVRNEIILTANAQASSALSADKYKDYLQVVSVRQKLESGQVNTNGKVDISDFKKEERSIALGIPDEAKIRDIHGDIEIGGIRYNSKKYFAALKKVEDRALNDYEAYNERSAAIQAEVIKKQNEKNKAASIALEADREKKATGNEKLSIDELTELIKQIDDHRNKLKEGDPKLQKLQQERDAFQKRLDALNGKSLKGSDKSSRGSRLTGEQRDAVKDIDAKRDEQIAVEKLKFVQLQTDEETYLRTILRINTEAADKKLTLLKGKNAEERKQIAELRLYKIDQETQTDKALFDLAKKELDRNNDAAKRQGQARVDKVNDDPTKTDQDKRREKEAFLTSQYLLQVLYNDKLAALEKKYGQRSLDEIKKGHDALTGLQKDYNKNNLELTIGTLEDIDKATEDAIVKIKLKYDKLRDQILKSNKSSSDKNNAITLLGKVENVEVGGAQQTGNNDAVAAAQKLFNAGLITAKQFEAIYAKAIKGQQDLNNAIEEGKKTITSFQSLLGNKLGKLFGLGEGSANAKVLGDTIAMAFNTAGEAMNNFFDAQANRIEQSNQLTQQKLDIELSQAKERSQSQAETDSLERQFAAKKDAENRKAFEKNKKLQIEQAKINLAIQLSNLAVIAFAPNPLNIATLGIAGAIMYGVQAALAFVNYASNVSKINSAKYAGGGLVKPVKVPNGRIDNPSNIPTQPNGDNIYATVKRGEVILNEEQQKRIGGPSVFKRIGIPGFASGGFTSQNLSPFGNLNFSNTLKPPVNPSSFLNRNSQNNNSEEMNELKNMVAQTTATILEVSKQTNERIDKIKVEVVSKEVEESNNNRKKASAIGTV